MVKNLPLLVFCVLICQAAGLIGALSLGNDISAFYQTLNKPFFSPPPFVFAPVWAILYTLMGVSIYLVWERIGKENPRLIWLFFIHLIVNAAWTPIFFGLRNFGLALVDILLMWLLIVLLYSKFKKVNTLSANLLLPYLAWVGFASLLNLAIFLMN